MSDLREALEKLAAELEYDVAGAPGKIRALLAAHPAEAGLDRAAVDAALRQVMEHADYDLHKQLECDEEAGEDTYADHVDRFITEYGKVEK